jgi:hypothetical protein
MSDTKQRNASALNPAVPPSRGVALTVTFVACAVAVLGLAIAWAVIARDSVTAGIRTENRAQLERARTAFEVMRKRAQDGLRTQCRVLSEDPRLKATLATDGIDEVTVADILDDLGRLRRGGFLLVLTPEARVFAQTGADELRGLDLSTSSVVQSARTSNEAVVGSWVIGRSIMDLAAIPIRSDGALIAYLMVGQAVERDVLDAVAASTGVIVAVGVGADLTLASTDDPHHRALLATIATSARHPHGQLDGADGAYVTSFVELDQTQTRPYLVMARSLETSARSFARSYQLAWVPPVLVVLALLLSRMRSKQLARMPRTGGV